MLYPAELRGLRHIQAWIGASDESGTAVASNTMDRVANTVDRVELLRAGDGGL